MPNWVSVLVVVAYNAMAGLAMFDLVAHESTAGKIVAYAAWLLGNVPALFGKQLVKFVRGEGPALVLVLAAFALSACSGLRAVSYKTLMIATDGATVAAEQLPKACEVAELEAAKKQPTKELKISESGKVHAQCETTAKALSATHDGLVAARNFVASAPDDPKNWPRWVLTAVQLFEDLRPLLAKFNVKLPEVKP